MNLSPMNAVYHRLNDMDIPIANSRCFPEKRLFDYFIYILVSFNLSFCIMYFFENNMFIY